MKRFILLLFLPLSLQAAIREVYVSSGGTNTNWTGTSSCSDQNAGGAAGGKAVPCGWGTMLTNAAAGDRVNVLAGTYSRTSSGDALTNAGTATSPIIIRGYTTTPGDGYQGRTNTNGPLITTNMPLIQYTTGKWTGTQAFIIFDSLNFTSAATTSPTTLASGADCLVIHCQVKATGSNAGANALSLGARAIGFDCDVENTNATSSVAVAVSGINSVLDSCRVKNASSTNAAVGNFGSAVVIYGNVIYSSAANGINVATTSTAFIRNNTIVSNTGAGVNIASATTGNQKIIGNMITDNGAAGIEMNSTGNAAFLAYNRTRDNSSAVNNGGDWTTATTLNHVTSGAGTSDYTNAGSQDYSLISTSPAKAANFQAYSDIGALQRQEAGAATTTSYTWGD